MKNIGTVAVVMLSLCAGFAQAQTATVPGSTPATVGYLATTTTGQVLASEYMDKTVYGSTDQSVGEIKDMVFDPTTGNVSAVVLGVGGFLGVGEKNVAVPLSQLKFASRNGKPWVSITATKDELKAAPDFKKAVAK